MQYDVATARLSAAESHLCVSNPPINQQVLSCTAQYARSQEDTPPAPGIPRETPPSPVSTTHTTQKHQEMDPLSIAASVTGLLALTGKIISTIRAASGGSRELEAALDGLQEVLETIDDNTTSAATRDRLYETLRRLEKRLEMKRTRFWSKGEVAEFVQEILTRRGNLQIAMLVENG